MKHRVPIWPGGSNVWATDNTVARVNGNEKTGYDSKMVGGVVHSYTSNPSQKKPDLHCTSFYDHNMSNSKLRQFKLCCAPSNYFLTRSQHKINNHLQKSANVWNFRRIRLCTNTQANPLPYGRGWVGSSNECVCKLLQTTAESLFVYPPPLSKLRSGPKLRSSHEGVDKV